MWPYPEPNRGASLRTADRWTINRSFAEVERLVASLRTATDGLAHDLKTPLTRIKARLELAELEGTPPHRLRGTIADSRTDLDTLVALIENILVLARAEKMATTGFEPVALDRIAAEAAEMFEPPAEENGMCLVPDMVPATKTGSRTLLAQAITNLLDNATSYGGSGGEICFALTGSKDELRLAVVDNGPGIPASLREQALARFHPARRQSHDAGQRPGP